MVWMSRGLVTAIVGGLLISLLGGSRVQIGGPTGAFIVVVAGVIEQFGFEGLLLATLLAGIILVAGALARVGRLIALVPEPVIEGFTVGIALIIAISQLKDFLGLSAKQRGELSAMAKALAGGGGGGGKRISIKGGVFRLVAGGKEVAAIDERYLDVVLVNAAPKVSRVFYMKKYDANEVAAPDCWSADGVTPSPDSENKQASRCDECAQNIAGSG